MSRVALRQEVCGRQAHHKGGLPVVYLYPFMIIQMMMGEPNRAVMELMGRMPCVAATCEMMSQASMMVVPHKMAAGMMVRWSDVRKMPRAMWGTVIPMKAIGPVNAVEVPARSAVDRMAQMRVRDTDTPNPAA